ncbi:MAG: DUF72 domain-containing protein [Nitrososphaerota archaeon]
MEIYVGTSGWLYDWNAGGSLEWYVKHSGLNAVELNMSFYRYPTRRMVESWSERGRSLRWSIKTNRIITHVYRLNEKAIEAWDRFRKMFSPMEDLIHHYLFQLPPSLGPRYASRIEKFASVTQLGSRLALEWRNPEWFRDTWIEWAEKIGVTVVSIDAPDLPRIIMKSGSVIYLRMHGRRAWYSHDYSDRELAEVASSIAKLSPSQVYVYFNNDHAMLKNAQRMLNILLDIS